MYIGTIVVLYVSNTTYRMVTQISEHLIGNIISHLPTIGRSSPLIGLNADWNVASSVFKYLLSNTFKAFERVTSQLLVDVLTYIKY